MARLARAFVVLALILAGVVWATYDHDPWSEETPSEAPEDAPLAGPVDRITLYTTASDPGLSHETFFGAAAAFLIAGTATALVARADRRRG